MGYYYYEYKNILSLEELKEETIYSIWNNVEIKNSLLELGFIQLENNSDDKEIFVIDNKNKTFYITYKQDVFKYFETREDFDSYEEYQKYLDFKNIELNDIC